MYDAQLQGYLTSNSKELICVELGRGYSKDRSTGIKNGSLSK